MWTGDPGFRVAVFDSGVDYDHKDFFYDANSNGQLDAGEDFNIWVNPGEDLDGNGFVDGQDTCPTPNLEYNCVDDDGNGYVDDFYGWNFGDDDNNPKDSNIHGTQVAGIIGAMGNNGLGVVGVTRECSVVPIRLYPFDDLAMFVSHAIRGMDYCMANDIVLSNHSWGVATSNAPQALYDAVARLMGFGHLLVVSAGNFRNDVDSPGKAEYPCSYDLPNVICVAATDNDDNLGDWPTADKGTNYGAISVDLAAPGTNIYGLLAVARPGDYVWCHGTSFAAPHVTGVAALVMTRYPTLTFDEVRRRILDTVRIPIPVPNPWAGKTVTEGVVNAYSAVADCNMNGVFDDCELDCNAGGCDPLNCGGASDCNNNSIPDDCDTDCDNSGVPDVCESWFPDPPDPAPSALEEGFIKNRYLSFVPTNVGQQTALRVVLSSAPSGFEGGLGVSRWVGVPEELSENAGTRLASGAPGWPTFWGAGLQCTPHFMDWSTVGTVHVYDNMIIPNAAYDIQTIHENSTMSDCTADSPSGYSTALLVSTPKWGDTVGLWDSGQGIWLAPDGAVGVSDYFTVLDKFQNKPNAPIKSRCDVDPELPQQIINITDVTRVLDAFGGAPYPFNVPAPCP